MKKYIVPNAEVKSFVSEDVITASGVTPTPTPDPISLLKTKSFSNSEANVSWKDIVG